MSAGRSNGEAPRSARPSPRSERQSRGARRRTPRARRRRIPPLWIAALAILIPVAVTYYAFHRQLPFTSSFTDYAVVPNSVNVQPDDPVRIAGIDVGSVTGTSPDGRQTKIAFTLDSNGRPIHTDATLTVQARLFLEGNYYLNLFPGSPDAPIAPSGFTIRSASTQTPVQAFQVLSTFDLATRNNFAQILNSFKQAFSPNAGAPESDSGAGGLKRAIPQLTPILLDTALISQAFTGSHAGDLERFLLSSSRIATTLAERQAQLADLVTGFDRTSSALASHDGALAATIAGIDQTLKAAPPALIALNGSFAPVTRLAATLTPSLRASPPLLSDLSRTVDEVDGVVVPAARRRLIQALDTILVTFPNTLTEIGRAFPATTEVSECLREKIVPLLQSVPSGPGALNNGQPVWKDFVHFLPNLTGASSDFDANGPYLRTISGSGAGSVQTGSLLGSLPVLGQLLGSVPSSSGSSPQLAGVAPQWVGDLTSADFRPDVPCISDPVPSVASNASGTGSASALTAHRVAAGSLNPSSVQLRRALARVQRSAR
jgi:phospholipid/cholesterol/gamma-HCH transport system substrate-binding protein